MNKNNKNWQVFIKLYKIPQSAIFNLTIIFNPKSLNSYTNAENAWFFSNRNLHFYFLLWFLHRNWEKIFGMQIVKHSEINSANPHFILDNSRDKRRRFSFLIVLPYTCTKTKKENLWISCQLRSWKASLSLKNYLYLYSALYKIQMNIGIVGSTAWLDHSFSVDKS